MLALLSSRQPVNSAHCNVLAAAAATAETRASSKAAAQITSHPTTLNPHSWTAKQQLQACHVPCMHTAVYHGYDVIMDIVTAC